MKSDKEIKKEFRKKFWTKPDEYYATGVLKEEGFLRDICVRCKKPFWSIDPERKVCGDPLCSGEGFGFIGDSPVKRELGYVEVWLEFAKMFKKLGYTPIKRYPVVARWNPTMEYTNASISAFQPYVISGEVEPPANPLVIPQFCLRFNDIDNVGVTQSHNTGFIMIGQHMFVKPENWDQDKVFRDIHLWLKKGLGLRNSDVIFHEDAWAGGGNFGSCMEFFSRGCELGNQVYMLYEQTDSGYRELSIKVLDMGMGQERNAWFSQGCETIYDATFPTVVKKLLSKTGLKIDRDLMRRYIPYAGLLNLDEVEDVDRSWKVVAEKVGIGLDELRDFILPLSGVYSVAEHMRSLLFALTDGGLPSNVGGGYNLRILARRGMLFKNKYGWDVDFLGVCEWHAKYLKPIFPELMENLDGVGKILEVEGRKYESTKKKSARIVEKLIREGVNERRLLQVYDSHGIPPEIIKEEFEKRGKGINIPDDFYSKVSELHEKGEQITETGGGESLPLDGVPDTKILYYGDYKKLKFRAKVLKVAGDFIVLDQTVFYPTSGGQLHDMGRINGKGVKDVFREGGIIVHLLERNHGLKEGRGVEGKIDWVRRLKLSQQHTATHIINAAARKVLGGHVNQAGAKKTEEKSHLDITHYEPLTTEEVKKIEEVANKIVQRGIKIEKLLIPRNEAEKRFGMRIYQGGAVPGKVLRVVNIPGVDVEACGGTHLNNTKEVGKVKILKTAKIQDGIDRIEFTAGEEAGKISVKEEGMFQEVLKDLGEIVDLKPGKNISKQLGECSDLFSVPADQVGKTVKKFTGDILKYSKKLGKGVERKRVKNIKEACETVFDLWKKLGKELDRFREERAGSEIKELAGRAKNNQIFEIFDTDREGLIKISELVVSNHPELTVILVNKNGDIVGMSKKRDVIKMVKSVCKKCGGSGGGKGKLAQGKLDVKKLRKFFDLGES
ncbi:MAG: alanine--tRNA ligase [Candidatus Aenigmatarchaeota archaeon]|nr:MAG: alanine--tRNA ligase [Candidatus Aenigmarchaeota archaeon]